MFSGYYRHHEGRETIYEVIARTADACFMPLTVGGGVRDVSDFRKLLLCGADKISVNSSAVKDPDLISHAADKFGSQCVVVAIDAHLHADGWFEVTTHGGRTLPVSMRLNGRGRQLKKGQVRYC